MSVTYRLDGASFRQAVKSGAVNLRNNVITVNELNVFPIPDGDTGENMARTVEGGIAAVDNISDESISTVAEQIAHGMLLSARGNSGVILSQFFEGVAQGLKGETSVGIGGIKKAFAAGVTQAYSAVVQPTEGTILTVMREASEKSSSVDDSASLESFFEVYVDELYSSLERTPELLPVLKEAGVIDSGGAGFVYIVEGMRRAISGEAPVSVDDMAHAELTATTDGGEKFDENSEMKFGYCTEVIVQLMRAKTDVEKYDVKTLVEFLESMGGESIVAFKTGTRVKLHVHTFEPDMVMAYCRTVGELVAVKVENMSIQHTESVVRNRFERQTPKKERKKYACVAVADGAGIIEQFRSLGADCVVDGKQTMNPSAGDFIAAFDEADADVIFVLPNNANVILAANQAAELYDKSRIIVINSRTLAEGYSALSMHDYSSDDADAIASDMENAVRSVITGLVTYSVRDCHMNGRNIEKGDFMGIADKTLLSCRKSLAAAACELIDKIDKTDKSVIIAVSGKTADEKATKAIADHVAKNYRDIEFYEFDGGQDVYSYIFVVE